MDDLADDAASVTVLPRPGSVRRLDAERRLRRAVAEQEFEVWFQPQVRLCSGEVVGYEALARWRDPERGVLAPDRFIHLAEETGDIAALGRLVLEQACRELLALDDRTDAVAEPWVAVNLSGRQLVHLGLADEVAAVLAATGLAPHRLWLEITETALMDDLELGIRTLYQLRAMGVHLSIDDFGTGWSTLSHVRRFPVEQLKIDRTFIEGLGRNADDTTIVTSIIALAHALGMHVVAEGVETREQLDALVELGCDIGQGWFWQRAVPPRDVSTGDAFREICRLHSHVVPSEHYATADAAERALTTALLQQEARAGFLARVQLDQRLAELETELASLRRLLTRRT